MNAYLENMFSLEGKTVVVTGGGQGIGQVISCGYAKAGAEVVVIGRTLAKCQQTVDMITAEGGKAYAIEADVVKEDEVLAAVDQIMKTSGKINILFNCAGICMHQTTFEATAEELRQVMDVNWTGSLLMARAVAKEMMKNPKDDKGTCGNIINMASLSATIVNIPQWQVSYNSSKAAVRHMTKSLALEWAEYGIRVNSISPGYIATPMSMDPSMAMLDQWLPLIPQGRMADPNELMPAILYLSCSAAGYTTGDDLLIDGGYSLQ
ncbi:MAG: SDR family oxidoreductase [Lachnospiraceae bacterium]|nr:SDR family oxidoreductase [Lachnospiraceae bacterium]